MELYSVILTVLVLIGVAVLILLFEKKRAQQIERDLKGMADHRRRTQDGRTQNGR